MNKYMIFKSRVVGLRFNRSWSSAIEVSPVKLSYTVHDQETPREEPRKSPVLFLHSALNSKRDLASLSKALNQLTKRTIIAIDARNHGESPDAPEMSWESMAADVKLLSENLKLNKSILMGHSMGGGIMVFTALKYPHLAEKLVVIEANPIETSQSLFNMSKTLKKLLTVDFQGLQTLDEAKKHATDALCHLIPSASVRDRFTEMIKEVSPGKFGWARNLPVIARDFERHVISFPWSSYISIFQKDPFTKPSLFIGGGQSDFLAVKHYEELKKLFPRAEFAIIEGANHWLHLQKPTEFLKISSEFINSD
ncbi:protein ABHD11 [Diachasma alloeum]|uniref:protein ABHD11 n=1 Tax=Diachasma alloeum TaxID=454923 RepID=UPI0007383163|nr:protein ABHD11 [Diachasma alloeum]